MEKIAQFLTDHISCNGIIEQKDYEIYKYGFQTGIELLLCVLTSIFIALIMHKFWECVLLICVFFSQRAYIDGVHLKHFISCYFFSCLVIAGGLVVSGIELVNNSISVYGIIISLIAINILPYFDTTLKDRSAFIYFQKKRMIITILIGGITLFFYVCRNDEALRIIMYGEITAAISAVLKRICG